MDLKKVLILDDEVDMAMTIADMLDFVEGHFEYEIVHNVDDALKLIASSHFDCIISDINLPGLDGIQFIQQLRKEGNLTPVIITSGRSDKGLKEMIQKVGGFDFLPKPFNIANVSDLVLASLRKSS